MKKIKFLLVILLAIVSVPRAWADDVTEVSKNGLVYLLDNTSLTAELFRYDLPYGSSVPQEIAIPVDVSANGKNYRVTSISLSFFGGLAGYTNGKYPYYADVSTLQSLTIPYTVSQIFGQSREYEIRETFHPLKYPNLKIFKFHVNCPITSFPKGFSFTGFTQLTTVQLPNDLKTIDDDFFNGCQKLTTVNIPYSLKKIGKSAFQRTAITQIDLSGNSIQFGNRAFSYCQSLTSVKLGKSNSGYIAEGVFSHCTALQTLTITKSSFDISGFPGLCEGCTNLETFSIPAECLLNVMSIPDELFHDCSKLQLYAEFGKLRSIGKLAFAGMKGFNAQFNNDDGYAVAAGVDAFYRTPCTITVDYGMKAAYNYLYAYKDVTIKERPNPYPLLKPFQNVTQNFASWYNQYKLVQLECVKRLKISSDAIYGLIIDDDQRDWDCIRKMCGEQPELSLTSLDLRDTHFNVGSCWIEGEGEIEYDTNHVPAYAFKGVEAIDTLFLPTTEQIIDAHAFEATNPNLVVHVPWTDPSSSSCLPDNDAFKNEDGTNSVAGMTLLVPDGCLAAYKAHPQWGAFGTIREEGRPDYDIWLNYAFVSLEAGTFAQEMARLPELTKKQFRGLIISGPLDGSDLREIRNLCGVPFTWENSLENPPSTGYHVSYLDLSKAKLVGDDIPFMQLSNNYGTTNYRGSMYAFSYLTQVDTLWLPASLKQISEWVLYKSNPEMVVYTMLYEKAFGGSMSNSSASQTLIVPVGRVDYYSNFGFGQVKEGNYEGMGTLTPEVEMPDRLTMNIVRGNGGGAKVSVRFMTNIQGGQWLWNDVGVNGSKLTVSKENLHQTWNGYENTPILELVVTCNTNRTLKVYCNNAQIQPGTVSEVNPLTGNVIYTFDAQSFGLAPTFADNSTFDLNIYVEFGDAVVTEARTMRFRSNSVVQDGISIWMFDKKDDGTANYDTKERLAVNKFHSVPVNKIVSLYFPVSAGNPNESNSYLTLNGQPLEDAVYSGEGHDFHYEVTDISKLPVWDFLLEARHVGDPDPDKVTHNVLFIDNTSLATAKMTYNETSEQDVNQMLNVGTNIIEMPKVNASELNKVHYTIAVPVGSKLDVYDWNHNDNWNLQRDEQTVTENGIKYETYHLNYDDNDHRMFGQATYIIVNEPDRMLDWNMTLLGGAIVEMSCQSANGTDLGNSYINESGAVQLNGKIGKVSIKVGAMYDPNDAFWSTHQLVVMADGQDVTSYFTTEPNWVGNSVGYSTVSPLSGDIINATNWVIGFKEIGSSSFTWTVAVKGDMSGGDVLKVSKSAQEPPIQANAAQPFASQTMQGSVSGMSVSVTVAKDKPFVVTFNGTDITSRFTKTLSGNFETWTYQPTASDVSTFATDGTWTATFGDSSQSGLKGDVNGDGKVTISDAVKVVNIIMGNE